MKHYKGFPYIKVGHFYKLQFKDAKAIAYCAYEDKFIIKSGSTAAFDCPDVNEYNQTIAKSELLVTWEIECVLQTALDSLRMGFYSSTLTTTKQTLMKPHKFLQALIM